MELVPNEESFFVTKFKEFATTNENDINFGHMITADNQVRIPPTSFP